jgi:hypothetical protein
LERSVSWLGGNAEVALMAFPAATPAATPASGRGHISLSSAALRADSSLSRRVLGFDALRGNGFEGRRGLRVTGVCGVREVVLLLASGVRKA